MVGRSTKEGYVHDGLGRLRQQGTLGVISDQLLRFSLGKYAGGVECEIAQIVVLILTISSVESMKA